jgi:hypothetical protein
VVPFFNTLPISIVRGIDEFTQEVADKPWGLREFEIRSPEGHRIIFGKDIDQSIT